MPIITGDNYAEKWVEFAADEKYFIRYTSRQKLDEITKIENEREQDDAFFDHIIKAWSGIFTSTEDEKKAKCAECSKENKISLIARFPDRRDFLIRKSLDARTFIDTGELEKN